MPSLPIALENEAGKPSEELPRIPDAHYPPQPEPMSTEPTDKALVELWLSAWGNGGNMRDAMRALYNAGRASAVTPEEVKALRETAAWLDFVGDDTANILRALADRLEKGQSR